MTTIAGAPSTAIVTAGAMVTIAATQIAIVTAGSTMIGADARMIAAFDGSLSRRTIGTGILSFA